MTTTLVRLSPALQALIDSRLDTIERMLLGRVSRQDRLAIVRDVETQIHELLQERGDEEIGRDEVLAVLARLDPPEAYLPEEPLGEAAPDRIPAPAVASRSGRAVPTRVARASAALGLAALALLLIAPVLFLLTEMSESDEPVLIVLFALAGLVLVVGVLGLALGIWARRGGAWALVGIVSSAFSLLFGFVAGGSVMLLLL
jgi:hypothetical protein